MAKEDDEFATSRTGRRTASVHPLFLRKFVLAFIQGRDLRGGGRRSGPGNGRRDREEGRSA